MTDLLAPDTEPARRAARQRYGLPDVAAEGELEALLRTAATVCGVPTATLNLVDAQVQCNYATVGFQGGTCAVETSMCATALRAGGPLHVPDARADPRFAGNPWVTGELAAVRLYASSPLRTPDGTAFGTLCVFDDRPGELAPAQLAVLDDLAGVIVALFERRRLAREAQAAVRAKSQFLAAVSHEVRTPVNGVLGMLDLLLAGDLTGEQRDRAELARRSAAILLGLLDGVLDLSKGEAGHVVLAERPYSPAGLVDDVVQVLRVLGSRKEVALSWRADSPLPDRVLGDPERLRQVLVNLVGNALKFTASGEVQVALGVRDEHLELAVRDTGEGIARQDLPTLFTAFEQGASGRRHGGTGLGLAICRQLVELMGGSIDVQSALGAGTTFTVRLPLRIAAPQEVPSLAGLRVLVADDDPVNRMVATAMLESFGAEVVAVEDGEQAVRRGLSDRWDAVVLDYEMPGLSGPETARRLRAAGFTRPLVALTGRTTQQDVQACRRAGMSEVLGKPLQADELARALAGR